MAPSLLDPKLDSPTTRSTKHSTEIIQTPFPNPSLQVTADHKLKSVNAPVYAPKHGEVLLQIKATGICG
jgi:hypothetical protein